MIVSLDAHVVRRFVGEVLDEREKNLVREARYHLDSQDPDYKVKLDVSGFGMDSLEKICGILASGDRAQARARKLVMAWIALKKSPSGAKCLTLESLPNVLKELLCQTAPRRWLFWKDDDGCLLPAFVSSITYTPSRKLVPASVRVGLVYYNLAMGQKPLSRSDGDTGYILFYRSDVSGKTVAGMLEEKGYYVETPEMVMEFDQAVERWRQLDGKVGRQMRVSGRVTTLSGWYGNRRKYAAPVGADGRKMVIDPGDRELGAFSMESEYWGERLNSAQEESVEEVEDSAKRWEIPVHPYLELFDLEEHVRIAAHVDACADHVYDEKVGDKLVLPDDVKDLIEALVHEAGESFDDIVEGKSGGVIVLITGEPGTGKTLTAEVYSEVMKRPLYKVNSSQLGVGVGEIEKELKAVLGRAEKWGAILLIDEADVYVHERGEDMVQNAIVGVFLRVLEYYKGVLFLTSNRATIIDDAIISRLTARMEYRKPTAEERAEIWRILAKQNGIALFEEEVATLVKDLPGTSGRDIKMLLKLASLYARRKGRRVDVQTLKFVNKFKVA